MKFYLGFWAINVHGQRKDVIHIYSAILFSHKKKNEIMIAICSNMDGPRECHTK